MGRSIDFRLRFWVCSIVQSLGQVMLRMRLANGVDGQMRVLAIVPCSDEANADITTRQNIQLQGVGLRGWP